MLREHPCTTAWSGIKNHGTGRTSPGKDADKHKTGYVTHQPQGTSGRSCASYRVQPAPLSRLENLRRRACASSGGNVGQRIRHRQFSGDISPRRTGHAPLLPAGRFGPYQEGGHQITGDAMSLHLPTPHNREAYQKDLESLRDPTGVR